MCGPACSGRFDARGDWTSTLTTRTLRFDQAGKRITGVEKVFDTKIFPSNVWGLDLIAAVEPMILIIGMP